MSTNCANCNLAAAFEAWNANLLYVDNAGNYRLRAKPTSGTRGPIAPWNKDIKRLFRDAMEFGNTAAVLA